MLSSNKYVTIKYSKSRLKERNEALAVLQDLTNLLSGAMDLEPLLDGALSIVLEHFGLEAGRIYLMDPSHEFLTLVVHRGVDIAGLEQVYLDEGFSGKAARTKSFIAQHVSELEDRERAELLSRKGLKIIICVPFLLMDRVVGVMNLAAKRLIRLDEEEIDLLMTMGHHIGAASSHAKMYRDLQDKLEQIEKSNETIKYFAYSVSHDLKSPAIGLFGLAERLHKHCGALLDERGKVYCEQILRATEQIVALAEQINAYIGTREVPLHIENVDMKKVLARLREDFWGPLREREVRLVEPPSVPEIMGDELRITRALRNLVDNALKYGGAQLSEITIGYEESAHLHIFSVTDDGVGIGREDPEKVFGLFQRNATSKGVAGTGLGLAIVKEIAERHGGTVWVEPGPERGTRFYLSIAKDL
jgi:signal transduction histidine kinase